MSSKKLKNKSLSEKVSESLSQHLNESTSDSDGESAPKVIHFDEEDYDFEKYESNKSFSQIRKQNVRLLSEQSSKYSGEITSRKNLDTSDEDDSSVDSENADISKTDFDDSEQEETSSCSDIGVNNNGHVSDESAEVNLVRGKNSKQETEKGLCVQNQLTVWEKLLEIRIQSQKMLNKGNSLPGPDEFTKLSSENEYRESSHEVKKNVERLLEKLIETQVNLAKQFSEINKLGLCSTKSNPNESVNSSFKGSGHLIKSNFEKFRPYRNSVLLKWDDRTKVLAPSGATKRKHLAEEFDIIRKVDNVLLKQDEHIAKSQKLKGNYTIFGKAKPILDGKEEVSSTQIYDDTDFYHAQLRELIEFKANVSSDAYDVTRQFADLQKLRQKMKKKVDTRASKGRKIRYVVHHKLINFMAPNNTSEWTEESKNELYRSLFVT